MRYWVEDKRNREKQPWRELFVNHDEFERLKQYHSEIIEFSFQEMIVTVVIIGKIMG